MLNRGRPRLTLHPFTPQIPTRRTAPFQTSPVRTGAIWRSKWPCSVQVHAWTLRCEWSRLIPHSGINMKSPR